MGCSQCQEELPEGARFCPSCGAPQRLGCASCGADLPAGARFCPACGSAQDSAGSGSARAADAVSQEGARSSPPADAARVAARRVTSVLFGDLVGFTTLAEGRDHEDVRELLSRYFETSRLIVERYGGVVEKFIGDAVMAVWGVPTANEDDAERAVRAGLELVAAVAGLRDEVGIAELDMRVGIVTGEVAVTLGAQGQGMVAGDAVNTAARVQSTAQPGQVWVDETTRQLTHQSISFVDTGSHQLKGKVDPVPLWAVSAVVAGSGGSQRADGLEAPLVGRDRELRLIKEVFHRTGEQGAPSLVIISGEPGVGKSRLSWEFEKYVDGLPETTKWHTGRCVAYGARVAYYALAEAIRARLRLTAAVASPMGATDPAYATDAALALLDREAVEDESAEDMAALLATALPLIVADEAEREWILPRLGALLGVGSLGEFARADLYAAWAAFLRRLGADAETVVLRIDDAEHADEGLVGFVEHLMASRFPVFVMMMARPSLLEDHPELARNPQAVLLNLAPLSGPDIQRLLDGLVADLPSPVREQLVHRSEGVPLYAVETVRSLIDRDLVVPRDGRYVLADPEVDLATIGAPPSLHALVAARLDSLTEFERRVVDAAAVLGQSFHRDHLAGMVGDGGVADDLDHALARLQRGQMVERETSRWSGDYGHYRFVQAVVPQVAYSMLARRERRAAHLMAVELFSQGSGSPSEFAPAIADHLTRAAAAVPDAADVPELRSRALHHLISAAERAQSLGALRECVAYLIAARDLSDDPAVVAQIDLRRGIALSRGSSNTAAIQLLEPLVAVFDTDGDEIAAGTAAGALARCLIETGREDDAWSLAEPRWLALKDRSDAGDAVVELAVALGQAGGRGAAAEFGEAVFRVGLRRGDERLQARGLRMISWHYWSAGLEPISRMFIAECMLHDGNDRLERVLNHTNLVSSWMPQDLGIAAEHGQQAADLVEELRLLNTNEIVMTNHVVLLLLRGQWDEALRDITGDVEFDRPIEAVGLDFVATVISRARAGSPSVPQWSTGDLARAMVWHRAFGRAALALRVAPQDANGLISGAVHELVEYHQIVGLSDDHSVLWPVLFEAARSAGDDASVEVLLGLLGDFATDQSIGVAFRAHGHWAVGLLAHDRGETASAITSLREAVRLYDEWQSPPHAGRARAELGVALVAADDPGLTTEGWQHIDAARATFAGLGATAWLDALEAALALHRPSERSAL